MPTALSHSARSLGSALDGLWGRTDLYPAVSSASGVSPWDKNKTHLPMHSLTHSQYLPSAYCVPSRVLGPDGDRGGELDSLVTDGEALGDVCRGRRRGKRRRSLVTISRSPTNWSLYADLPPVPWDAQSDP